MTSPNVSAVILSNIVVILAILHCVNGLRSYTIEFLTYNQEFNTDVFRVNTYRLINTTDHRLVLNGSAILHRDVEDFEIKFVSTVFQTNGAVPWKLLDFTTNACEVIKVVGKKSFLSQFLKSLKSFGNLLPDKCPFRKDVDYNLKNLYFDANNFAPYIPQMIVKTNIQILQRKFRVFEANTSSAVQPRCIVKNPKLRGQ